MSAIDEAKKQMPVPAPMNQLGLAKHAQLTPQLWIPPKTRAKLETPAAPGGRNYQMVQTVLPLIAQGLCPDAIFAQFRSMYEPDVADSEIRMVIEWGLAKNPQPCGFQRPHLPRRVSRTSRPQRESLTPDSALKMAEKWLDGSRWGEADLWHFSPWQPLEDWRFDSLMLFAALYDAGERVNVVTDYVLERKADGNEKAKPKGAGITRTRDEWMRGIRDNGVPQSKAGAWIRPNPVSERGAGKGGAFTDADVTAFRFLLLENDLLPLDLQLSMLARLGLPTATIIQSGGNGPHAWVKVDSDNADNYRETAKRILKALEPFGFDQSNKNPSRMSRLPGAKREIGAQNGGEQRLIYLNPEPRGQPILGGQNGHCDA
jgi:hypothetical protein